MSKKIKLKSFIGILFAFGAGVAAFVTEMDSQKKDRKIEEFETRIANLEQKGGE